MSLHRKHYLQKPLEIFYTNAVQVDRTVIAGFISTRVIQGQGKNISKDTQTLSEVLLRNFEKSVIDLRSSYQNLLVAL